MRRRLRLLQLFLANAEDVRDWNIQGLPADAFSTENGVMVTRGTRWPLMIDPQEQANKWVKNMEKENQLKICTLKKSDFLRTLENAIQFGQPVLLQEVEEELDPSLEPIMSRAIVKVGNRSIIKLGDKEVDYNPEFRFYLTTKLANPHYTPEISTKATICNFCVKQQGSRTSSSAPSSARSAPSSSSRRTSSSSPSPPASASSSSSRTPSCGCSRRRRARCSTTRSWCSRCSRRRRRPSR